MCETRCSRKTYTERLVCRCVRVTEAVLVAALTSQEIKTVKDIRHHTGAGDGCTCCHKLLKAYLESQAPAGLATAS